MFIDINDSKINDFRATKECIVCGATTEYVEQRCGAYPCSGCSKSDCSIRGNAIVNVPLCDIVVQNKIDCRKLLHGWDLLERDNKLNDFIAKFSEFENYNYPSQKYVMIRILKNIDKNKTAQYMQECLGAGVWQVLK